MVLAARGIWCRNVSNFVSIQNELSAWLIKLVVAAYHKAHLGLIKKLVFAICSLYFHNNSKFSKGSIFKHRCIFEIEVKNSIILQDISFRLTSDKQVNVSILEKSNISNVLGNRTLLKDLLTWIRIQVQVIFENMQIIWIGISIF